MRTTTRFATVALIGFGTLALAGCRNPVTGEDFSPADVRLTVREAVAANPDISKDEIRALLGAEYGLTIPRHARDLDGPPGERLRDRDEKRDGMRDQMRGEMRGEMRDGDRLRDRDRDRDGEGDLLRDRDRDRDHRDLGGRGGR